MERRTQKLDDIAERSEPSSTRSRGRVRHGGCRHQRHHRQRGRLTQPLGEKRGAWPQTGVNWERFEADVKSRNRYDIEYHSMDEAERRRGQGPEHVDIGSWNVNGARIANRLAHIGARRGRLALKEVRGPRGEYCMHNAGYIVVHVQMEERSTCCATGLRADLTKKSDMRVGEVNQKFAHITLKTNINGGATTMRRPPSNSAWGPRGTCSSATRIGDPQSGEHLDDFETDPSYLQDTVAPAASKGWSTRRDWASGRTYTIDWMLHASRWTAISFSTSRVLAETRADHSLMIARLTRRDELCRRHGGTRL